MNRAHLPPKHSRRSGASRLLAAAHGFTAVELIVVIGIMAILAAIAVPSYNEFIARSRMDSAANELVNAAAFARTEAIRTRSNVVIAKRQANCRAGSGTAQDWSCGFVAFKDANRNGTQDAGGDEPTLREVGEVVSLNVMHVGGGSDASVTFNPFGVAASSPGRFVYTPERGGLSSAVTLCMSSGGRIRKLTGNVNCPSN